MGDIKACTLPLIKISHMLQSDCPNLLDREGVLRPNVAPCHNAFREEGTKDSVEEIYWLPCNSQCKPITCTIWPAN